MTEGFDRDGLLRLLSMSDTPEQAVDLIENSEWLLRHEFRVVRAFLTGCLQGVNEDGMF